MPFVALRIRIFPIAAARKYHYFEAKSFSMRTIFLTLGFLIFLTTGLKAQDDVFSNKTNVALEKVIKDFPNRFHNIKGDVLVQQAQTTEYKSTVQVPGANACIVTKRSSQNNDSYSWSCAAFASRDFNLAKTKFREIYDQIENTIIKVDGQKPFIVSGQYRTPYEQRKLTNIVFELLPAVGEMKNLKVELSLQYTTEWKISLSVYDAEQQENQSTAINN